MHLNQLYLRGELALSSEVNTSLSLSSALSAYQTDHVVSLSGKVDWEFSHSLWLGGEFSFSSAGLAVGPTFLILW